MRQKSKKRKEVDEPEYRRLSKQFLHDHPLCEGCIIDGKIHGGIFTINRSTEIQHRALRGKWYLRTDTWAAVCRYHGQKCTDEPEWAYATGMRMTREEIRLLDEAPVDRKAPPRRFGAS